jgi:hypothetical protein
MWSRLAIYVEYIDDLGDRGGTVVKVLCYKSRVAGSIPDGVTGIFH